MIEEILKVLPSYICVEISKVNSLNNLNEIRLRARQKIILKCINQEIIIDVIVTTKIILDILLNISKNSMLVNNESLYRFLFLFS